MLFAFSLIVVGIGGLIAVTFGGSDDSGGSSAQGPTSPATTKVKGIVTIVEMGPAIDEELAPYAAARTKELEEAKGDRVAVVSFKRYLSESEARSLAGGAEVNALLAALPGGSPSVVNGSIEDWLSAQFAATREERHQIEQLLPTVDDEQFLADYRARIEELNQVLGAVNPDQALVFGLVLRAPAAVLQALARSGDVRMVDVGPAGAVAPDTIFRGLRPEETAYANQPPSRPA